MNLRYFRLAAIVLASGVMLGNSDCNSSDSRQQVAQEKLLVEANAQTGLPAIKNFRERRLLKDILELRDQDGLATFTYLFGEQTATLRFFCNSIGYGIPYATQYTNPEKWIAQGVTIPQADPNALFSPASAEGTWVMCSDPASGKVAPTYVEPRIVVSTHKLIP